MWLVFFYRKWWWKWIHGSINEGLELLELLWRSFQPRPMLGLWVAQCPSTLNPKEQSRNLNSLKSQTSNFIWPTLELWIVPCAKTQTPVNTSWNSKRSRAKGRSEPKIYKIWVCKPIWLGLLFLLLYIYPFYTFLWGCFIIFGGKNQKARFTIRFIFSVIS